MGLDYGGFHDFAKEEVLDAVVIDGSGPAFNAETYKNITIQIDAAAITLGADIIVKKSLDGGVTFIPIAQIDKAQVAIDGNKVHEVTLFDEPLGQYQVEIDNRGDGTYTGTARASK